MPIVNPYAKRKEPAGAPAAAERRPAGAAAGWSGAAAASSARCSEGLAGASSLRPTGTTTTTTTTTRAPPTLEAARGSDAAAAAHAATGGGSAMGDAATTNSLLLLPEEEQEHHLKMDAQPHLLYVSTRQRGNSLLRYIRNVPWAYANMVPDYVWSSTRCALFLSVKYHGLHPNYLRSRIGELGTDFSCRVLLVLVDVQDCANLLLEINVAAVRHGFTLLLSWSDEEAARYLETFKAMDGKDASLIQRQLKSTFCEQAIDVLVEGGVNKTDAGQLLSQFGTLRSLVMASPDELGLVVGMGPVKVQRLHDALHKPFSTRASADRKRKARDVERLNDEASKEAGETPADDDSNEAPPEPTVNQS